MPSLRKQAFAASLPDQRLHDVRHYAATFFVAKGVPMRVVMDILGHSKMATTADLYAHVLPAAHREVADLIDQSLQPRKRETAIP
jgi:integrase